MNNATTIDTDSITITEALKRLRPNAPARQSFYDAINRGKIIKSPDPAEGPGKEKRVLWSSVQAYIGAGGFKQCRKIIIGISQASVPCDSSPSTVSQVHATLSGEELQVDLVKLPQSAPPQSTIDPISNLAADGASSQRGDSTHDKKVITSLGAAGHHDIKHDKASDSKAQGRHKKTMRVRKNELRCLDVDQLIDLRDWTDKRILQKLGYSPPVQVPTAKI